MDPTYGVPLIANREYHCQQSFHIWYRSQQWLKSHEVRPTPDSMDILQYEYRSTGGWSLLSSWTPSMLPAGLKGQHGCRSFPTANIVLALLLSPIVSNCDKCVSSFLHCLHRLQTRFLLITSNRLCLSSQICSWHTRLQIYTKPNMRHQEELNIGHGSWLSMGPTLCRKGGLLFAIEGWPRTNGRKDILRLLRSS